MKKFLVRLTALSAMMMGMVLAADVGPPADIAGVRAAEHRSDPNGHVSGVHIVGNYALVDWYGGEASGYAAFKRISGERWARIDVGGGVTFPNLLTQHGVPASIAHQLCSGWSGSRPCVP